MNYLLCQDFPYSWGKFDPNYLQYSNIRQGEYVFSCYKLLRVIFVTDIRQWEYISYCLSQLAFTEKGMKKLMEAFKTYEHALSEDSIMEHFRSIINKVSHFL